MSLSPNQTNNPETALLPQEDLLLRLLVASDIKATSALVYERESGIKGTGKKQKGDSSVWVTEDAGKLLPFPVMKPNRVFTFDAADRDRIFPSSHDGLMAHPTEILGLEAEVGLIHGNIMKWSGFRKLPSRPKGICTSESGSHTYYERHFRIMGEKGGGYYKRIVAFNKAGAPVLLFKDGTPVGLQLDGLSAILACGLIEDANRRDAYLCSIQDGLELLFPLAVDDVFEFFALREAPLTPSGRRKALIHWVSEHLRNTSKAKKTTVRQHYRGITEFSIDGLTVKVTPNRHTDE